MSSSQNVIEHAVLFKIREDCDPTKVHDMVTALNSLASIVDVLYLTAGPVLRNRYSSPYFTYALHSRFRTKDNLEAFMDHPHRDSVVNKSVIPAIDDFLAFDWVAEVGDGDDAVVPPPGSAIRATFMKLKENLGDEVKPKILEVIEEAKGLFPQIKQLTFGENLTPEKAKGYWLTTLAIFPGIGEMEELNSKEELVAAQLTKVEDYFESVFGIDYVVPAL